MERKISFYAGMPHLDIHTLAEEWAFTAAAEGAWEVLSLSLGKRPSQWLDSRGDRMYGAVVYAQSVFDLDNPVLEDDVVEMETRFEAIRKPHALTVTSFRVNGTSRLDIRLLMTFVKRVEAGSNKKFSKVRDVWTEDDFAAEKIDDILDRHHQYKDFGAAGEKVQSIRIPRVPEFNNADLMYFRNYVRQARGVEWLARKGTEAKLPKKREAFYFGNVNDGELMNSHVTWDDHNVQTLHFNESGKRIFFSETETQTVDVRLR